MCEVEEVGGGRKGGGEPVFDRYQVEKKCPLSKWNHLGQATEASTVHAGDQDKDTFTGNT